MAGTNNKDVAISKFKDLRVEPIVFNGDRCLNITPRNLEVFILRCGGLSNVEIAKHLGMGCKSVSFHYNRVKRHLQGIDVKDLQAGMRSLYPLAFQSMKANLEAHDVKTTLGYCKGIQALVPRHQTEGKRLVLNVNAVKSDLGLQAQFDRDVEVIDDEFGDDDDDGDDDGGDD